MFNTLNAGFGLLESKQVRKAKNLEAEQLNRAAIAREAAGTLDAYEQRKLGERVESDAIAAMAAAGGVVESDALAKIKATTDYNVLASMFAAGEEAKQMRLSARLKRYEGKMGQRMATAKLLTAVAVDTAMMSGPSSPSTISSTSQSNIVTPSTGVNLNYDQFASYA